MNFLQNMNVYDFKDKNKKTLGIITLDFTY